MSALFTPVGPQTCLPAPAQSAGGALAVDPGPPGSASSSQCAVVHAGGCRLELHIHIHQGVGGSVSVNQVQQAQAQAQLLIPPESPRGPDALAKLSVIQLLRLFGVRDAIRYASFPKDRVMCVVNAARAKKRKNVGGWIATALSRDWDLSAFAVDGEEVAD